MSKNMKVKEKEQARMLRQKGLSIYEIVAQIGCAKSSVSIWVRDIELKKSQRKRLSERGHTLEAIEKRRTIRLINEKRKRDASLLKAQNEIELMSKRDLWFFGIAAYWGEGSKRKQGSVEFFNSDPRFIRIMMRFFQEVCRVPKNKFKGRVQIHTHLDAGKAEMYWARISGIPLAQFQTTAQQKNKASKNQKDTLPFGTFMIAVYDTQLLMRILGWCEGVHQRVKTDKLV